MESLYVINSNGAREPFSFQKLYRAIRRVNVPKKAARDIARIIEREAYPGIKTSDIFQRVEELLYKKTSESALRFNLKEGMRKLGPTGFLFEKFVGEIFKKMGFEIKINLHIPGHCIYDYEIDFIARKEKLIYIGECKYRNVAGEVVHLRDALANHARFLDIFNGPYFKTDKQCGFEIKSYLVTNAKFAGQAIDYSNCVGVDLLGWRYPKNNSLEYLIEKNNLYPVTILPSLEGYLKDVFVSEKKMLVEDVVKINPEKFSKKFKIPADHLNHLIEEAKTLIVS